MDRGREVMITTSTVSAEFKLYLSISLHFSHIVQTEFGEDRKELFVKCSFELSLPPHLIIPSSSIKLTEIIGQGTCIEYSWP